MNYNVADVLSLAKATMKIHEFDVQDTMLAIRSVKGITDEEFDLIEKALIEIRIKELGMTNKDLVLLAMSNSYTYNQSKESDEFMVTIPKFGWIKAKNLFDVIFDILG